METPIQSLFQEIIDSEKFSHETIMLLTPKFAKKLEEEKEVIKNDFRDGIIVADKTPHSVCIKSEEVYYNETYKND